MDISPRFTIIPEDARVTYSTDLKRSTWGVRVSGRLPDNAWLRTPDEKRLQCEWVIFLYKMDQMNRAVAEQESLGVMTFVPEGGDVIISWDDSFEGWACLSDADMETLMAAVASGATLKHLSVRLHGADYGWEPDGSGTVWDVATTPSLQVKELSLTYGAPLLTDTESNEEESSKVVQSSPITHQANYNAELQRIGVTLNWLLGAVCTAVAILAFR